MVTPTGPIPSDPVALMHRVAAHEHPEQFPMPSSVPDLVRHSLALIEETQSPSGAWVASPTFPTYQYSWFRDGAFIADAVSRHDRVAAADRFHAWCLAVLAVRREQLDRLVERAGRGIAVPPEQHLRTRYTPEGKDDDQPWENFQLDGYGTWLWALCLHRARHHAGTMPTAKVPDRLPLDASGDTHGTIDPAVLVEALVDYLAAFWDQPSYDWWEEHAEHRHTSTLGSIWAGLDAVSQWAAVKHRVRHVAATTSDAIAARIRRDGIHNGHLVKWPGNDQVDASLVSSIVPFWLFDVDDPVAVATITRIEHDLVNGGVHRYLDDVYYGGGQWVLLTGFLGWYHARAGNEDRARELLEWMVNQADDDLDLPEQVAHQLLHPTHLRRWQQRWGPSAKPLLWSHAMLLDLVDALGDDVPATKMLALDQEATS